MSCSKRVLTLNTLMSGGRGYNFLKILSLCFWLVKSIGWGLRRVWLFGLGFLLGLRLARLVLGWSLIFRITALLMWLPHHQGQEVGLELVEHQKIFDKSRRNLRFALKRQEQKLKDCVGNQNLRSFMPCLSNDYFTLCLLVLFGWEWRLGLFKAFKSNRNITEKPGCLKGDFSS